MAPGCGDHIQSCVQARRDGFQDRGHAVRLEVRWLSQTAQERHVEDLPELSARYDHDARNTINAESAGSLRAKRDAYTDAVTPPLFASAAFVRPPLLREDGSPRARFLPRLAVSST